MSWTKERDKELRLKSINVNDFIMSHSYRLNDEIEYRKIVKIAFESKPQNCTHSYYRGFCTMCRKPIGD